MSFLKLYDGSAKFWRRRDQSNSPEPSNFADIGIKTYGCVESAGCAWSPFCRIAIQVCRLNCRRCRRVVEDSFRSRRPEISFAWAHRLGFLKKRERAQHVKSGYPTENGNFMFCVLPALLSFKIVPNDILDNLCILDEFQWLLKCAHSQNQRCHMRYITWHPFHIWWAGIVCDFPCWHAMENPLTEHGRQFLRWISVPNIDIA